MGGKNPALVMASADLDQAVQGVYRSAFGMNGHKCSACSRVYVHQAVADEFLAGLSRPPSRRRGDPLARGCSSGPLATKQSYEDYQRYIALARAAGEVVRAGGRVLTEGALRARLLRPADGAGRPAARSPAGARRAVRAHRRRRRPWPASTRRWRRPTTPSSASPPGCSRASRTEIDAFFDRIEAGVVYVNRAAGATTGAWPGVQPFGGWKGSGSTGKNIGGHYTLPCYMREQSRTVCGSDALPSGDRRPRRAGADALAARSPSRMVTAPPGPQAPRR